MIPDCEHLTGVRAVSEDEISEQLVIESVIDLALEELLIAAETRGFK